MDGHDDCADIQRSHLDASQHQLESQREQAGEVDADRSNAIARLLADLQSRCLTPYGSRRHLDVRPANPDAAQGRALDLAETRRAYYVVKLIYDALSEVIVLAPEVGWRSGSTGWPEIVRQNMMTVQCSDYWLATENAAEDNQTGKRYVTPLGVLPSDRLAGDDRRSVQLTKEAHIELEDRIERRLDEVTQALARAMHTANIFSVDPAEEDKRAGANAENTIHVDAPTAIDLRRFQEPLSTREATLLANNLDRSVDALDRLDQECDELDARLQAETFAYLQVEHDTLDLLITLLADPEDSQTVSVFSDYFGGVVDSTRLKLAVLHAEIQRTIYSGRAPDALRKIRELLVADQAAAERELAECLAKLHEYQSAGSEYQTVAAEHGELLRAIEEAEEDIRRIQSA
ncbi:HAUS augmin-like complex subunit 4-domain-containing protein [Thamnocephalis sphaerospora]|uniref:HAUS augmin-like complex subunit 4-domain-containing protein n=1 Tax=Thamnocephalis sphaerospora TaxID=78915 RepID=A0A4P9XWW9_9FUNG|nr:HAUS augmin-like complex subunit 4-domain-containing protein [Thamnocephalis sphaerospora]|eukprot:RKP10804.1 HAUS augmin-like complex subunit 4-domain-containing protein [Thamnocephalis sphaerospora]